jgi:tetratricopeptide (TPR) repeat protein
LYGKDFLGGNAATTNQPELSLEHAYIQLAQTLVTYNKIDEALPYYEKALEYNPHNLDALYQVGTLYYKKGDYTHAISPLERYYLINEKDSEIIAQLCAAYTALGNQEKAIFYQQKNVALNPTELNYINLGNLFVNQGDLALALAAYEKALALNPQNYEALLQKAHALQKNAQMREALAVYDQLLTCHKKNPSLLLEKASLLSKLGDTDAAVNVYQQLLPFVQAQKKISLLYTIGATYRKGGKLSQAQDLLSQIVNQHPEHAQACLGLAKTYLSLGDYNRGWSLMAQYNALENKAIRTITNPNQIQGKKIFIGAEWMLEDMVQLVRYAKTIKDAGGTVIMQTPPQIYSLLKTCPFITTVVGSDENSIPPYHAYIPITSLPALFGTTLDTIPHQAPYFDLPQDLVDYWHIYVKNDTNLKIGLLWKKNESLCYDPAERASIPITLFKPLTHMPGISLYCLQQMTEHECASFEYRDRITFFGTGFPEDDAGLLNLAALMKNLDLIITIDCSAAHIAGALGIPVWVALAFNPCYRWIVNRTDYPWYPSMRLFRQADAGKWEPVIEKIIEALAHYKTNGASKVS